MGITKAKLLLIIGIIEVIIGGLVIYLIINSILPPPTSYSLFDEKSTDGKYELSCTVDNITERSFFGLSHSSLARIDISTEGGIPKQLFIVNYIGCSKDGWKINWNEEGFDLTINQTDTYGTAPVTYHFKYFEINYTP